MLSTLVSLACILTSDPAVARQSERDVVQSNLTQLALGIKFYAMDYDNKFAFNQSTMKAQLKPYYRKDSRPWTGADGKPLDVRINPVLVGKLLTSVVAPESLVMLSIGPKANLRYFDGQTPIAFADYHVKWFTKDAVSQLRWK